MQSAKVKPREGEKLHNDVFFSFGYYFGFLTYCGEVWFILFMRFHVPLNCVTRWVSHLLWPKISTLLIYQEIAVIRDHCTPSSFMLPVPKQSPFGISSPRTQTPPGLSLWQVYPQQFREPKQPFKSGNTAHNKINSTFLSKVGNSC